MREMDRIDPTELGARFAALPGTQRLLAVLEAGEDPAEAYLVGGTVRDLWLGRTPRDVDVVLVDPADPAQIAGRLGARPTAHDRFGTATVSLEGLAAARCDLALARRERYPRPGALPQVEPAGIDEDLTRRDFTVNAIALGIAGPRRGELIAVPDALQDLGAGQLRVLHDASFVDDPTRLLRLARYAGRLGYAVEPHTAALARAGLRDGVLDTISGPRLGAELELLLGESDPVAALGALHALGIDAAIAPGFGVADPGLLQRALAGVEDEQDASLELAVALLDVRADRRRALLDRLGLDRRTRDRALAAAADAPALVQRIPVAGPPSQLYALLPLDQPATIALARVLAPPAAADAVARYQRAAAGVGLAIDGDDLLDAGIARGPAIGVGLRAAFGGPARRPCPHPRATARGRSRRRPRRPGHLGCSLWPASPSPLRSPSSPDSS